MGAFWITRMNRRQSGGRRCMGACWITRINKKCSDRHFPDAEPRPEMHFYSSGRVCLPAIAHPMCAFLKSPALGRETPRQNPEALNLRHVGDAIRREDGAHPRLQLTQRLVVGDLLQFR